MVACLEKTEGNFEFDEIVDFVSSSTIHHALTVSPTIYTSYIKQFWNTASSQTINDEKQIHATVDSKAVVVAEASIRSFLLFNDADGTACLTNEAIFQNLALICYEEGEGSGAPTEPQPIPYPIHPSTGDQPPVTKLSSSHDTTQDSRDSFEGTNGSEGDQVQSPYDSPLLSGHTSDKVEGALNLEELFSICTNLSNRLSMKKRFRKKKFVSKQGRKKDKPKPTLDDSILDGLDADLDADHGIDYMDTKEPANEGRLSEETEELKLTTNTAEIAQDKGSGEKEGSTEELVSIARPEDSTVRPDDKGKGVLEEPGPAKKMTKSDLDAAQIAKDAEVARLVYEEELAELEREKEKRQREEESSKAAIAEMYDEVQAGIIADALFAAKLQQEEREEYTIKERAKFLAKTIADDVVDKEKVLEEPDSSKVDVKLEGDEKSIRKRPGRRLKMKATKKSKRQKIDSDLKEEEHLNTFLQIVPDEKGKVNYEVLDKIFPIINWESKFYHLDIHGIECIYYRIFKTDGSSRWIKPFSEIITSKELDSPKQTALGKDILNPLIVDS
nr:xylulose kinase-1 [Tanacetum cinerariifolium]